MSGHARTRIATLLVISMMLSGCSGDTNHEPEEVSGCTEPGAENYNPDATVSDSSCVFLELEPEEPVPQVRLTSQSEFCDDVNPHHCLSRHLLSS